MRKLVMFISASLLVIFCRAQPIHKDQLEYGYKGAIKTVIKKTFEYQLVFDSSFTPNQNNPDIIHTYYFNNNGNIDSARTERVFVSGDIYSYSTVYKFDRLRKSEWTAFSVDNEKLLYGKITWASDKQYTEKVYAPGDILKYEATSVLNDSFRVIKTRLKHFDDKGGLMLDEIHDFELDKLQNVKLYKTSHNIGDSTEMSNYKYLGFDKVGNPMKVVISKPDQDTVRIILLEYIYYE